MKRLPTPQEQRRLLTELAILAFLFGVSTGIPLGYLVAKRLG